MNDDNYKLLLQLLGDNPVIIYIVGVFLSLVAGVYVTNAFKALLPQKKEEVKDDVKTPDKPYIVIDRDEDTVLRLERHIDDQSELLRAQRDLMILLVDQIKIEKKFDETIPIRDDQLDAINSSLKDSEDIQK